LLTHKEEELQCRESVSCGARTKNKIYEKEEELGGEDGGNSERRKQKGMRGFSLNLR